MRRSRWRSPPPDSIQYNCQHSNRDPDFVYTNVCKCMGMAQWKSNIEREQRKEFLHAFLTCGTISRTSVNPRPSVPTKLDLGLHFQSVRRTGNPKDFTLAVMPQYDFYTVPVDAKQMIFRELFVDCFQQGARADWGLWPLLAWLVLDPTDALPPTDNIPEPVTLGDAVRLFLGACPKLEDEGIHVEVVRNIEISNSEEIFGQICQCISGYLRYMFGHLPGAELLEWTTGIRPAPAENEWLVEFLQSESGNAEFAFAFDFLRRVLSATAVNKDPWLE